MIQARSQATRNPVDGVAAPASLFQFQGGKRLKPPADGIARSAPTPQRIVLFLQCSQALANLKTELVLGVSPINIDDQLGPMNLLASLFVRHAPSSRGAGRLAVWAGEGE